MAASPAAGNTLASNSGELLIHLLAKMLFVSKAFHVESQMVVKKYSTQAEQDEP